MCWENGSANLVPGLDYSWQRGLICAWSVSWEDRSQGLPWNLRLLVARGSQNNPMIEQWKENIYIGCQEPQKTRLSSNIFFLLNLTSSSRWDLLLLLNSSSKTRFGVLGTGLEFGENLPVTGLGSGCGEVSLCFLFLPGNLFTFLCRETLSQMSPGGRYLNHEKLKKNGKTFVFENAFPDILSFRGCHCRWGGGRRIGGGRLIGLVSLGGWDILGIIFVVEGEGEELLRSLKWRRDEIVEAIEAAETI